MVPKITFLLSFALLAIVSVAQSQKMKTEYEWKYVDYAWPSPEYREAAIKSGDYDYEKSIIIDSDVSKDGRVFVTVVRRKGVPASLTTIDSGSGPGGPLLMPYPDWSWTDPKDCSGIISVYRVAIDKRNRLWVVDNGHIDEEIVCQPKILAFDLATNELLYNVTIPDDIARNSKTGKGLLVNHVVDVTGPDTSEVNVFIADVQGNALVVYRGASGQLKRMESLVHSPQAGATRIEVAGEAFELPDGILGMALSSQFRMYQPRYLYTRPLASYDMIYTKARSLADSTVRIPATYKVTAGILPSQASAMAFSSNGRLFLGLTNETALACWDMDEPLASHSISVVDQNPETHQFTSGLKVIKDTENIKKETVWMVTNRYQKFALNTQNFAETNYRIMSGLVEELIIGSMCDKRVSQLGLPSHPDTDPNLFARF